MYGYMGILTYLFIRVEDNATPYVRGKLPDGGNNIGTQNTRCVIGDRMCHTRYHVRNQMGTKNYQIGGNKHVL